MKLPLVPTAMVALGAPALLLVIVSAFSLIFMLRRETH